MNRVMDDTDDDKLLTALIVFAAQAIVAVAVFAAPLYDKREYHTSALTGEGWVQELINGHPLRIKNELGMTIEVFQAFVYELSQCGIVDSKYVSANEQVAIFLYSCVTGLSVQHIGERFQHSNETISRYFWCQLLYQNLTIILQIFHQSSECFVVAAILLNLCPLAT